MFTMDGDPISNLMIIETIKDFLDLFIFRNFLMVKILSSPFFKLEHDLDRDVTWGHRWTFGTILSESSKSGGFRGIRHFA